MYHKYSLHWLTSRYKLQYLQCQFKSLLVDTLKTLTLPVEKKEQGLLEATPVESTAVQEKALKLEKLTPVLTIILNSASISLLSNVMVNLSKSVKKNN